MIYQRIKYFLAVCEAGSIKKAASQLYISAPALTKQMNILEEEIGGKLFKRTPKGVVPTWLGEFAQKRLTHLDMEFQSTLSIIQSRAKQEKSRVNIGIFGFLPQDNLVSPFMSLILSSFPEYQININMVDLEQGKKMMLNKELDLLLTNTHEEDNWTGYKKFSFASFPTKVIVSLFHPWAIKDSITTNDMKEQTFLKMHMDGGNYTVSDDACFYNNIPCIEVKEVSNFHTLFALVNQGNAFAVFPEAFAYRENARIKCFDYPGRQFMYHTSLICNTLSMLDGLDKITKTIVEEFGLTEY